VPLVGRAMLTCLTRTRQAIEKGSDVSLVFISRLVAKFGMIGFAGK